MIEPGRDTLDVLQQLSETPGLSGHEHPVRALVTELFEPLCDELEIDALGNLVAIKRGQGTEGEASPLKVMWAAHMDEIGFMVARIEERGFLRITNVGGIDVRNVLGEEVVVHGREDLIGVIGAKPPHLTTDADRRKPVPMDELFVDVGLTEEEARERVRVGDLISVRRACRTLTGRRLIGKALDNRAGVAAMYHGLKLLQNLRHGADVYAVATVQEEVGLRGATTSAFGIQPDMAIAIDVGFATAPGQRKDDALELGKGPGLLIGANAHPGLHEQMTQTARRFHIPVQVDVAPGRTGTDAWAIQVVAAGVPTSLLSVPLRHMHSAAELLDVDDVEATGRLLAFQAASISPSEVESWKPPLPDDTLDEGSAQPKEGTSA